jgi:DNA segregation ATPase FtsK/SpoIIIE-like protein
VYVAGDNLEVALKVLQAYALEVQKSGSQVLDDKVVRHVFFENPNKSGACTAKLYKGSECISTFGITKKFLQDATHYVKHHDLGNPSSKPEASTTVTVKQTVNAEGVVDVDLEGLPPQQQQQPPQQQQQLPQQQQQLPQQQQQPPQQQQLPQQQLPQQQLPQQPAVAPPVAAQAYAERLQAAKQKWNEAVEAAGRDKPLTRDKQMKEFLESLRANPGWRESMEEIDIEDLKIFRVPDHVEGAGWWNYTGQHGQGMTQIGKLLADEVKILKDQLVPGVAAGVAPPQQQQPLPAPAVQLAAPAPDQKPLTLDQAKEMWKKLTDKELHKILSSDKKECDEAWDGIKTQFITRIKNKEINREQLCTFKVDVNPLKRFFLSSKQKEKLDTYNETPYHAEDASYTRCGCQLAIHLENAARRDNLNGQ